MKLSYAPISEGFEKFRLIRWANHHVLPGNGAYHRGFPHLKAMEPLIFKIAERVSKEMPEAIWLYTPLPDGDFYLQPMNCGDIALKDIHGNSIPLSPEAAGMGWTAAAFYLSSLSLEDPDRYVYLDRHLGLLAKISAHPEKENIDNAYFTFMWPDED